jgi:sporulation protein YlmC with PRC-barrel domain
MSAEVNIELLIGCKVFDESGKAIGRIEEILAVEKGEELVVSEYHLGREGLFERLSVFVARGEAQRIPWQELDLSDPQKPVWRKR